MIYFATFVNQPIVQSTFIFQLLETFVIGNCVCILVSLIIFPAFVTMDIENRVNYTLLNLGKMHLLIVQAFLREDQMDVQALFSRASIIEKMILEAISPIQMNLAYARFEPSRLLQWVFNPKRRNIIDLTLQGSFSQ
jgi:hypothetical protein